MQPLLSVITCTRNSAAYLPDTLRSLDAQTFRDFEHVIVDGGSTDGTLAQLDDVRSPPTIVHGADRGIADAMNQGTQAARGKIVLHLHSDDYLAHPRVLARVADRFVRNGCKWLFGRTLTDFGGGWTPEAGHFPVYSYGRLLRGNLIPHPATFVDKALLQSAGGFDTGLRFAMDYDMWLKLGRLAVPLQIPEFLAVFRRHAASATHANRMASFLEDHAVRRRHLRAGDPGRLLHELIHLRRRWQLDSHLRQP